MVAWTAGQAGRWQGPVSTTPVLMVTRRAMAGLARAAGAKVMRRGGRPSQAAGVKRIVHAGQQ